MHHVPYMERDVKKVILFYCYIILYIIMFSTRHLGVRIRVFVTRDDTCVFVTRDDTLVFVTRDGIFYLLAGKFIFEGYIQATRKNLFFSVKSFGISADYYSGLFQ